ncbi:MAG: response regulator [Ignavibacteriae bacterium]|nr:MAG: response regulator [Ignavibacteriota bacterium]
MSSKKILIIDDEPDVVTYLSAVLEANGYKSYATSNIKTAMEQVEDIRPDLICLDIVMPQETGISFYTRLRQDKEFKNIPVILISGIVELEKFDFRTYTKDDSIPVPECYMEKPIDVEKYIQKVKQLTG